MERQISFTLPSPTETPYRTPSSSLSRRTPDYEDRSPYSTPPPLPADVKIVKKRSNESQNAPDDNLSPLDPRRFTPTLHASLVSEILSLRRDLQNKTNSIDQLELSLDTARAQNDALSKSLLTSNKEVRSVKRQMQLLEGGTLSALNDLSKERDDAVKEGTDLRDRLARAQKRAKTQEDNADRTQALWEQDKNTWTAERRTLETKAQIAEGRLRAIIDEITQTEAQSQIHSQTVKEVRDHVSHRPDSRSSIPGSPTTVSSPEVRRRRQSVASVSSDHYGGRNSALSFTNGHGINLADELALDDIEEGEQDDELREETRMSLDALEEERPRPTSNLTNKARKVLGLAFGIEPLESKDKLQSGLGETHASVYPNDKRRMYKDSAVQYSPPPSPRQASISDDGTDHDVPSVIELLAATSRTRELNTPVMVSSGCQTSEQLPSPPLTPKQDDNVLTTIHESTYERAETKDISTQTDVRPRPGGSRYIHSRTSTHDLGIPSIAIIPPTSRPVTPETNVVLPPRTKNAGCQVDPAVLFSYTTSSMQTEEIRIDKRNIFSPHLLAGASSIAQVHKTTSRAKANAPTRRESITPAQPLSNSSSRRIAAPTSPVPPPNDNGPLATDSSLASSRPIRSSSLFAGFEDEGDELGEEVENDMFYDDELSARPTARFTLRSGKLVSQDSPLADIGEFTAANAGEAMALDNLRRSEITLPPELRQFDRPESPNNVKAQTSLRRAPSATKSANVRRSAMISSGVAAHQHKLSQSTMESASNDGSLPPPIPIPLRYSSARAGKAYSESGRTSRGSSNGSPTRQFRQKYRPMLRKARSGPAISPAGQTRRPRSRSPPLNSRVSIVPEMPHFEMPGQTPYQVQPPLTNDEMSHQYAASAPRPAIATGPRRSQLHQKQASDPLVQQTSVVDAIAQTMVGEWMYKYVRRRKSFGKIDKDWDPNKSVEELTNNPASAGVRHKRWVWLAPYERAVMWSSKQPMSGNALLGKSGRKLTVKSVLDVKDENPMPKNSLTGPIFNRSILILTPQRALKFTATSQERHFVWLTALSFLSHSPLSIGDLAALPLPPDEYRSPSPPSAPVGGSFRRRALRDSIRIAKGPSRQEPAPPAVTDGSYVLERLSNTRPSTRDMHDPEDNSALPPAIKRFHTRIRSNTAPRPPNSFSLFNRDAGPSAMSNVSNDASRQYTPTTTRPSRRGSDASTFGRPVVTSSNYTNFSQPHGFLFSDSSHNASMTMRMDAFIDNKQAGKGGFRNLRLAGASRGTNKDVSYWGLDDNPNMVSPADSLTPTANTSIRVSESTGRGSVERDAFRGF